MQDGLPQLILGCVVFILIVLIYCNECHLFKPTPPVPAIAVPQQSQTQPLVGSAKLWEDLSPDEKLDYLVTKYLGYNTGEVENQTKIQNQNQYILSLPQSDDCNDDYADCPSWASNGECDINPEYMLYNCKKSCKSCALNPQQRENISEIFNSRNPPSCVYHGKEYPGPLPEMLKVLNYGT